MGTAAAPAAADGRPVTVRDFRRGMRAANGGGRGRFDAPMAPRTVAFRAVLAVVVAALVASQVGPWGPGVRDVVGDWIRTVLPVGSVAGPPQIVVPIGLAQGPIGHPSTVWPGS